MYLSNSSVNFFYNDRIFGRERKFFETSARYISSSGCSHLEAVVSPRAELHHARLLVEGKIFDVDLAGRLVNRRRLPLDPTRVVQCRLRRQRHLKITVGAVEKRNPSLSART